MSEQVKTALGLATLRIPLLPEEVDASKEGLVLAVGNVVSQGTEALDRYPALLKRLTLMFPICTMAMDWHLRMRGAQGRHRCPAARDFGFAREPFAVD